MRNAYLFIIKTFFIFGWRKFARSPQFGQRLAARIFAGLMGIYMTLVFLAAGYFLPDALAKIFPDANMLELVNGYIFFLFLPLIVIRFFMQKMPAMALQAFLPLPLRKLQLVSAYLSITLLNFFNFMPVLLALPFWVKSILPVYPLLSALLWLLGFLLLGFASNLIVLLCKIFSFDRPMIFFASVLALVGLVLLDQTAAGSILTTVSSHTFGALLAGHVMPLLLMLTITTAISLLLVHIMKKSLYFFEGKKAGRKSKVEPTMHLLKTSPSLLFMLLKLEVRLFLRNRISFFIFAGILAQSILGLLFLFFLDSNMRHLIYILIGIDALIIAVAEQYLAFSFKLRCGYFDGFLTRPVGFSAHTMMMLLVAGIMNVIIFGIIIGVFAFISPGNIFIILALGLYAVGFVSFIFLFISAFDFSLININATIPFVSQAKSTVPLIKIGAMLSSIILPAVLLISFGPDHMVGVYVPVAVIGLSGILAGKKIMALLETTFEKQKYKLAEGFRQK